MKESLSEQEEVSTRRSRRARKRVQDSNFVFIWFWIPDLWIYLLARHVQGTFDEHKHESQMFSLSIVYWFFYYPRSDSQQTTKKARYDAICVQECPNFNIWGYGLRSKRFEGSRLYSKIILGLQAKKRWGSGLHGKKFRAPGLRPPPPYPPTGALLYRHECFTGKYTTHKIHKNYIRDPNGVFSMISHVSFIDDVISLYYFIDVFLSI